MKQLILIRHAKSEHVYGVPDHKRKITQQGVQATRLIAQMAGQYFEGNPLIWCSPALRTQATAAIFSEYYAASFNHYSIEAALYTFSKDNLVKAIQSASDKFSQLIIFGHNEGITDFVNTFGNIYISNVPTSGLVPFIFDTPSWKLLQNGTTGQCLFPKQFST